MNGNRAFPRCWLLGLILQANALPALAIDARVRSVLEQEGVPWIGQQMVLKVELLSEGFSFSSQRIHLPDIPGALVLEDAVSTVKLTEKIDGETWQVLSYHYPIFAQRPGRIEVGPIAVSFSVSQGYGTEPVGFDLQTGALSFEVRNPPGVDDPSGLVTAIDFSLKVEVTPEPAGLKVGDALTRTITRTAPSVSGMAFTPLPSFAIPGVAVYPKPPEVDDRSNRGELTGTRIESTTYVLQQHGELTIPGFELQWWDPVDEKLHTEKVPELKLEVAVNPDLLPRAAPMEQVLAVAEKRPWTLFLVSVALIAAISAGIKWLPAGLRRMRRWRRARLQSEGARYKRLLRACRNHQPAQAYNAYFAWANGEGGPASEPLRVEHLRSEFERLQFALVSRDTSWRSDGFLREVQRLRKDVQRKRQLNENRALPALNP